jgi:serine protease AprX
VLSVKVAGRHGAADVSTVLAAIQWVVSFRDRYNIRVLNLSLGTDSTQAWQDDPLNYAVERAWDAGIAVVVAASNRGPALGTIAKPGDDPWVVTVGAVDDRGTPGLGDDQVPDFSSRGPTAQGVAKPDVVAPGGHVLSLRAPGSTLERAFPPADPASRYRSGSGTSMAAAVVSGVAAVALQAHPGLTPNQLKHALVAAGRAVASRDPSVVGAGMVDAYRTAVAPAPGSANTGLTRSAGRGDLGLSRGSLKLQADDPLGTPFTGRQTAQLLLWDPLGYTTGSWTPSTWYTSAHATVGWNTAHWSDVELAGHNWTGHNWTGHNWTGHNWTGHSWSGSSWYGQHDDRAGYGRAGAGSASYGAWD